MFDRNELVMGRVYPSRMDVTVTENRAPTDDSVKLLREMEKAALERVLSTIRLEDSPVSCVVVHRSNVLGDADEFIMRYMLGGKVYDVRCDFTDRMRARTDDELREAVWMALREALAKHIASVMLAPAFNKLMAGVPRR